MTTEKAFRIIVGFFILFFALFAYILFPLQNIIHPSKATILYYSTQFPYIKWFVILIGKWSFALYYAVAELYPVVVYMLLFWQLANKITKTEEAKRFYSFFCLFAQISLVISGITISYFASSTNLVAKFFANSDCSKIALNSLTSIVTFSGICTIMIQKYIDQFIVNSGELNISNLELKKLKLGILDSLKIVISSRYLIYICILMISYSFTVNLIEGLWFFKVRQLYSSMNEFMSYQGKVLTLTGAFSIVCAIYGSTIIRKFGWKIAAIITPIVLIIVGSSFFASVLFQDILSNFLVNISYFSPLLIIAIIGGMQNILGKGVKYSIFDSTKEMVYIPLDPEFKTKGKAAVDVIGPKIGKLIGAFIQFTIFTILPNITYSDIAGTLMSIFILVCSVWIFAVIMLSKDYLDLLKKQTKNIN